MRNVLIGLALLSLWACNEPKKPVVLPSDQELKEGLEKVNKMISQDEKRDIDAYIKRYGWNMKETGTGLRYMIYKDGDGETPKPGDVVWVEFQVNLLDGTLCYSSQITGEQSFVVDFDSVESGLHEGIKLLKEGASAKFIIPSHLAFGLVGDGDKIPPLSPLVYDIELLQIEKP
jgi:FKBP-type peptidyl-prolyl cis-trans isomerase